MNSNFFYLIMLTDQIFIDFRTLSIIQIWGFSCVTICRHLLELFRTPQAYLLQTRLELLII